MKKVKITIQYGDKEIKGEVEIEKEKEMKTKMNRLYRKLKKQFN